MSESIHKIPFIFRSMFAAAFHIPPDFDDTFVNIGLGSLLKEIPDYSDLFDKWRSTNSNVTSVLQALKRYAYRPHSNITRVNTIDPRTYFYLHHFLAVTNKSSAAFVPTWVCWKYEQCQTLNICDFEQFV